VRFSPSNLRRLKETSLDPRAPAFSVAVALLSRLLLGLTRAYSGPEVRSCRKPSCIARRRTRIQPREHNRTSDLLVVAQVALALVLPIASNLMFATFNALHHIDLGFTGVAQLQTSVSGFPGNSSHRPKW
jgi:hypothetical protein